MPADSLFSAPWMFVVAAGALGAAVGPLLASWCLRLTPLAPPQPRADRGYRILTPLATSIAFAFFTWTVTAAGSHLLDDVGPGPVGWHTRLAYHLVLIVFLIAATLTDLRDYVIPDQITLPGTLLGILVAFVSGEVQIMHLWVDWSQAVPGLSGPWVPAWIDHSRHWHGLAVSLCGLAAGAGLTWIVRWGADRILGREALGFGDVTLMGMIGSYLGWQPILFAFLLAPIGGMGVAIIYRVLGGRSYVPYGPFLVLGAYAVLCGWRWIWMLEVPFSPTNRFSLRHFFGDAVGLAILAGIACVAFVVLLGLLRGYRAIPVRKQSLNSDEKIPPGGAAGLE